MEWLRGGLESIKVCLPQHSDAPPSAFYPVNQSCSFCAVQEAALMKKDVVCMQILSSTAVYRTDPDCDVADCLGLLRHREWKLTLPDGKLC